MSTIKGVDTIEQLRQFCPGAQIDGQPLAAPPPAPQKPELVAPAVLKTDQGVLVAWIPVATASESNSRDWRARSKRSNAAWRAVSRTLGPNLMLLASFATAYHAGRILKVQFARLGGRRMDNTNVPSALKGAEDAVAFMLGADDGDKRWQSSYWQHPGGPMGVRVQIEVG